jgi:WD repeat-containing protein 61
MVKLAPLCHKPHAHDDELWALAWDADRAALLTGSLDESVKRWTNGDDDGSALRDLSTAHTYTGHTLGVCALDVNGDGLVAASALDGVVRAWDGKTGETRLALESAPAESWGVKFDPAKGSTLLAIGGGVSQCVHVYDVRDGEKKKSLELPATTAEKPKNGRFVHSVAYSPDGKRIACGATDGTVGVFDVKTGKCVHTLTGHVAPVRDITFSPDGKTLYTACDDGYAHVYDAQNKSLIESLSGHKSWVLSLTASPDGTALVTGSSDATIKLWDLKTRACAQTMTDHADAVWCVRFSRDGAALAAASADRSVSLFNVV